MELTEQQQKIMDGLICPYCKIETKLIDSIKVYNKSYGLIYYCEKCGAYVGCHNETKKSKGRLANTELRKTKIQAHKYFDKIWKLKYLKRNEAYKWLSEKIDIPVEYTHIGMLGAKKCKDVVYYSKQLLNDFRRLDLDFDVEPKTEYYDLT